MIGPNEVREGMVVRSSDGKKLGRVLQCINDGFVVEKGFFFAKDYLARYDEVTAVVSDELRLSRPLSGFAHTEKIHAREGGLGETFAAFAVGGSEAARSGPWARADAEERDAVAAARGDEEEAGPRYDVSGRSDPEPLTYGDEGGGGLL